ncbi:MAG TPA: helix-turn-helix transcriptional regulator [Candidatus Nanopelagicales bacterium]|nr:helix-turn-helix transcriptional regulator [Candidatus Nanopelagicales bacterium]
MTIRAGAEPAGVESILSRVAQICETEQAGATEPLIADLVADLIGCDGNRYECLPDAAEAAPDQVWIRAAGDPTPALCLLTHRGADPRGWALTRAGGRFNTADVARGVRVLPLLVALDRHLSPPAADVPTGDVDGARPGRAAASPVCLTARERAVLSLIADGLTATAVAHRLAVAPSTVRKHLENTYAKIGLHDRLAAVLHAQRFGLI